MSLSWRALTDPDTDWEENLISVEDLEERLVILFSNNHADKNLGKVVKFDLQLEELADFIDFLILCRNRMIEVRYNVKIA